MHIVLFDIDGTLLNSGGAGQAAMEAAIAEEFGAVEAITGIPFAGRTDRGITEDIFRFHNIPLTDEARERFLATYLRRLPEELERHPGLILPGVALMLAHLHARDDVFLGLLTGNILEGARRKLTHYGLDGYFDFELGAFGDEHASRDDVARRAWSVWRKLPQFGKNLHPGQIWVVGDTPADIQCARAIGAQVLAVATGRHDKSQLLAESPDRMVDCFAEAEPLLEEFLGSWLGHISMATKRPEN